MSKYNGKVYGPRPISVSFLAFKMDDDGTEYDDDEHHYLCLEDDTNEEIVGRLKKLIKFLKDNKHRRVTFE